MFAARTSIVAILLLIAVTDTSAIPIRPLRGESAATYVTAVIPGNTATFQNHRLEVVLYEIDPLTKGRETILDRHNQEFQHNRGFDTVTQVTLGTSRFTMPGMHYHVAVAVYDKQGKRTQLGEFDGKRSPGVLTQGLPDRITLTTRLAKKQDIVIDIAEEIKRGNDVKAKQIAKDREKDFEEFYDIAELYRPRKKTGIGWGGTPPAGVLVNQDGLEIRLRLLERAIPANFGNEVKNNEEAAYYIGALAELTVAKPMPFKQAGRKSKVDWNNRAMNLRNEADQLAQAITGNNPVAIQAVIRAINKTCNDCHDIYRD